MPTNILHVLLLNFAKIHPLENTWVFVSGFLYMYREGALNQAALGDMKGSEYKIEYWGT